VNCLHPSGRYFLALAIFISCADLPLDSHTGRPSLFSKHDLKDQLFSSVVVLFPTAARAGATAQLQSINHLQVLLLTSPILFLLAVDLLSPSDYVVKRAKNITPRPSNIMLLRCNRPIKLTMLIIQLDISFVHVSSLITKFRFIAHPV
jgi:hypothetical protein